MAMDRARRSRRAARRLRRGDRARPRVDRRACRAATAAGPPSTPTTHDHYLNNIPFCRSRRAARSADRGRHRALRLDAGAARRDRARPARRSHAASHYLRRTQLAEGSLVRPLGHELHLRHLVGAVRRSTPPASITQTPAIRKAVDWLVSIQNPDGGWGEDAISYRLDYKGLRAGAAAPPSQTAWALLGLMAAGEVEHPAVERGIEYLQSTQTRKRLVGRSSALHGDGLSARVLSALSWLLRSSFRSGRWRGIGI